MEKILIADSDEIWRKLVADALPTEYQIFDCADGDTALDILQENRPDLLVLDLMIPGRDVLGILKELHYRPRIIVTGRHFSAYISVGLDLNHVDLTLMKPCAPQNLADRIEELLHTEELPTPVKGPFDPITAMLMELGIRPSQQGFRLLRTGIELLAEDPTQMLTKQLYPDLAALYNTGKDNVEKTIRSAVKTAWLRRDNKVWGKFFTPTASSDIPRPTSGQFLCQLTAALTTRNRKTY